MKEHANEKGRGGQEAIEDEDELEDLSCETRIVRMQDLAPSAPGPLGRIQVDPLPAFVKPRLEGMAGPGAGHEHTLTKPLVIIGRVAEVADVVLPDDAVSRHHAAIAYRAGRFTLYDLGSSNGTYVAGQKVGRAELEHGSEITIGRSVLVFWSK